MRKIYDNFLIIIHLSFIVFTFYFTINFPFYLGFLLIILHKGHELYFGECLFTYLQQKNGFSKNEDDFFYYLFNNKLNLHISSNHTENLHLFIKTIVLIIVLFKTYKFYI